MSSNVNNFDLIAQQYVVALAYNNIMMEQHHDINIIVISLMFHWIEDFKCVFNVILKVNLLMITLLLIFFLYDIFDGSLKASQTLFTNTYLVSPTLFSLKSCCCQ